MFRFLRPTSLAATAAILFTMLLAGCRDAQPPADAPDYSRAVQQLYVAYFGRPADKAGLDNFQAALAATGVPPTIQGLDAAYTTKPAVRQLVNSLSTSAESSRLYSGDTTAFVSAIYRNVLNRSEMDSGLLFWVDAIDKGGLARANAALSIIAGAQSNDSEQGKIDAAIVARKTDIAVRFTSQAPAAAYQGDQAASLARTMLSSVTATTDLAAFQPEIDRTIAALGAGKAQ